MAKKPKIKKIISEGAEEVKAIMQDQLAIIAEGMINQIAGKMKGLTYSNRLEAINNIKPIGLNLYKSTMLDAMVLLASDAIEQARKEVPKAKKVKLSLFGYFRDFFACMFNLAEANIDKLPPKLRDKIVTRNQLLIGKQVSDLQAVIEFAYATSEDETDSDEVVLGDLRDSALGFIDGTAISAGATITASTVINEAREAFFFDDKVLEEIEAFQFVNGDPVSEVCQDLAGTVFAKDDPDLFRYTPPLHWNCKSYIEPILVGGLGNREIEKLQPSTKAIEESIQFHESQKHACSVHA